MSGGALVGQVRLEAKKKVFPAKERKKREMEKVAPESVSPGTNLLLGDGLVINAAIDEASELSSGLLNVRRLLGDGELLEELVQDLEGLGTFVRHIGGGVEVGL